MGEKMIDEELDKLFEQMDRETAKLIDNQHTPTKKVITKKVKYIEPAEYIPEHIRKEFKIGEYAEPKTDTKEK